MATYDLETRTWSDDGSVQGMWGQVSYPRLVRIMRTAGEIGGDEEVTHIEVGTSFIRFRIKTR